MHYREANEADAEAIVALYRSVAAEGQTLARSASEITLEYVNQFITRSLSSGLIIVGEHPDKPGEIIAEIHAYKPGINVFDHVLSDLTIAVRSDFQGKKIGRTIFTIFLQEIGRNRTDIGKVELVTRESNAKAIALYQSLGFKIEGRLEMRIKTPSNNYEADIPMGWQNPNYEF